MASRLNINMAAVVGLSLALLLAAVAGLRSGGWRPDVPPSSSTAAERTLLFVDRDDGALIVRDADTGQVLSVLQGEQGFVRGTLRGLVRERKRLGLPNEAPLRLRALADGRLTLSDAQTGQQLELHSFGSANAQQYAQWLNPHLSHTQR